MQSEAQIIILAARSWFPSEATSEKSGHPFFLCDCWLGVTQFRQLSLWRSCGGDTSVDHARACAGSNSAGNACAYSLRSSNRVTSVCLRWQLVRLGAVAVPLGCWTCSYGDHLVVIPAVASARPGLGYIPQRLQHGMVQGNDDIERLSLYAWAAVSITLLGRLLLDRRRAALCRS